MDKTDRLRDRLVHRALSAAAAALVCVLVLPALASAGAFMVTPTQVYISSANKTATVKVTNQGSEEVGLQLSAVEWGMDEAGANTFTPVKEIAFFPKITRVGPGQERTIRVGFMGEHAAVEKTYRIFIQEIPSAPDKMSLKVAIRLSVPVFIVPAEPAYAAEITAVSVKDGALHLSLENSGNMHVVVRNIKAEGKDSSGASMFTTEQGGWYVLPGMVRTYVVDLPADGCAGSKNIKITMNVDAAVLTRELPVDAAGCVKRQ